MIKNSLADLRLGAVSRLDIGRAFGRICAATNVAAASHSGIEEALLPVKRSESASYLAYGKAMALGNYRKALACLLDYISESDENFDAGERSHAALQLSEVYYLLGDVGLALFVATLGLESDKSSPLTQFLYAKLIGKKFNDAPTAIAICDSVLRALQEEGNSISSMPSDDFSREEYIEQFSELARELRSIEDEQSKRSPDGAES